ncbi:MAG: DUF481 domain-containing protein [Pseudomonadales bacterium]|nr:DUF481 domain-containing protein [Pseudomonadales bacterium]
MKKIVSVVLLFCCCSANAITNIENQRFKPLPEGNSGSFEFTIDGQSGNSDEQDYGIAGRFNHKKGDDLYFLIATKDYGKSNDLKDTDKSFIHGRWVHKLDEELSSEAFVQYQEDEFTRLLSRYLTGGGVRYRLFNEPKVKSLAIGAGAFYVFETEDFDTFENKQDYLRLNSYASYKHQFNDHVGLVATAYFQPRASQFSDYNVLLNTSLISQLTEQLQLKVALKVSHDSKPPKNDDVDPPISVKETDTEYSASIVYDF